MDIKRLLITIMRTEGISLLQAQGVVNDMVSEAVDEIRKDYESGNLR